MESQFKLLALYREKLCFAPTSCSSRANESWRYVSLFTRKYGYESGSLGLVHDHYCKIILSPSSRAQFVSLSSGWRTPGKLAHSEPSRAGTVLMRSIPRVAGSPRLASSAWGNRGRFPSPWYWWHLDQVKVPRGPAAQAQPPVGGGELCICEYVLEL